MSIRNALAVTAVITALGLSVATVAINSTVHANDRGQSRDQTQKPKPAQDPGRQDSDVLVLNSDLVMLDVTVIDAAGNKPVLDLKQDQFQVFEDKAPQKIEFFSREQVPVSVVFAIDTSGSMKPKLDTVIKASVNLAKEARPGDEMAVVDFKDSFDLVSEFTEDVSDITDSLQNLTGSGRTAMLDALYLASDYAHKEAKNRRRAVILVTDGLDRNSYYKFDEVVERLRELDVQIYLIGFTNDLSDDGAWVFKKSDKDKAEGLLNRLASETGGRAFFPKELPEVHTIAQQISTDLRTQYAVGYYPTNSKHDGTFRTIRVQVNASGSRRLVARTRNGYTAPREGEPRAIPAKQSPN